MSLISDKDQQFLKDKFNKDLTEDVIITLFTQHDSPLSVPGQECMYCKDTRQLLEEVVGLSDKLKLEVYDFLSDKQIAQEFDIDGIPAFVIGNDSTKGVRYFGIPGGYEFSSLIEDIIDVSHNETNLPSEVKEALAQITQDVHIQVFVTPTCPYCPGAARVAHQMAIENPHIKADVVEATEFPQLSQRYHVSSVPKTVVNEKTEFIGSIPPQQFLQQVQTALAKGSIGTS